LLRQAGGSTWPMCGRESSRGRGEGLEVFSRHGIRAGHGAHRGSTHGGAAAGSTSREAGDQGTFYSGHKAVVREFPLCSKAADRGMGTTWARGGNVRRTEQPVAARRARTGECGHAAWHRPRGLARITPPCRTVPTALASDRQSLSGLDVRALSTTVRTDAVRRDVTRSRRHSNDLALFDCHKLEFLKLKCTERPIRKL
jgi:hypothetical protein